MSFSFLSPLYHQHRTDYPVCGRYIEIQRLLFMWFYQAGGVDRVRLRSTKAAWASSVHSKRSVFFIRW